MRSIRSKRLSASGQAGLPPTHGSMTTTFPADVTSLNVEWPRYVRENERPSDIVDLLLGGAEAAPCYSSGGRASPHPSRVRRSRYHAGIGRQTREGNPTALPSIRRPREPTR